MKAENNCLWLKLDDDDDDWVNLMIMVTMTMMILMSRTRFISRGSLAVPQLAALCILPPALPKVAYRGLSWQLQLFVKCSLMLKPLLSILATFCWIKMLTNTFSKEVQTTIAYRGTCALFRIGHNSTKIDISSSATHKCWICVEKIQWTTRTANWDSINPTN